MAHKIGKHKQKGPTTKYGFNYSLLGMNIPLYEDNVEKYMKGKEAEKRKKNSKNFIKKGESTDK